MRALRLALVLLCLAGCAPAVRRGADGPPFADLSKANRANLEMTGLFQPDKLADRAGIYTVQPYQPGKIPVLFIHGFISTPATWTALYENLQADPELRERCQFWFYYYPTGNPYLVSAADLRERLTALREQLDPNHTDPALDNIVLIGSSMGGLVAKLLTVDGGDDFWRLVCAQPFETLRMKDETQAELQRIFYFHRLPMVRRVVFVGTPHHGAKISATPPAKLAASLVQPSKNLIAAARDLAQQNPRAEFRFAPERLPSSLTLLRPGDAALELLAARPRPPAVHYHTILGLAPPTSAVAERLLTVSSPLEKSDGVVAAASAHMDDVESEFSVPAYHTKIQSHPQAMQEVRRILREHLRAQSPER